LRSLIKPTTHNIVGAFVFLIALLVLGSTVSPTESFWDCGEFIAAAFTVGVPHPPGTPLYILIGRLFTMIPFVGDIGMRVNLLSALVSAFSSLLTYLIIVRLARNWRGVESTAADKWAVYGSAALGAFALTFSHSFWFNAVEAEVYGMSMTFTALAVWLSLKWLDVWDKPTGNMILLLIAYITGIACGVHLLNVLILLPFAYVVSLRFHQLDFKTFIVTGLIGSAVVLAVYPGVIQGAPMLITKISIWGLGVVVLAMVWGAYYMVKRDNRKTALAIISMLLVLLGYSTFLIIKIRSGMNPFLDENDPETWKGLLSYLNREQYGTESLFLTMFQRKAAFWSYQIRDMYLRYLGWQFLEVNRFYAIPFVLGIFGFFHQIVRDKKGAIFTFMIFIVTGLAIVMYLNQDNPQPRERDYAYVGSYFAFAIWIGLGALALIELAVSQLKKLDPKIVSAGGVSLLMIAAPVNMLVKNYHTHDRSGNFVAWDYSYNLLQSCEQDAILYTNGDNDTFPLWYLQVVDNVRPDVRVVNLSLLNTGWFIKQIRDKYPQVPMPAKITNEYVDNVIESREISGLMDRRWAANKKVQVDGPTPTSPKLVWEVPGPLAYPVGPNGQNEYFLRVQDLMILNTIAVNAQQGWKRPIYFAVTVSDNNLVGLRNIRDMSKNYLSMEGLVFRVHPAPVSLIDPDKTAHSMMQVYKYRGVQDPSIYFDDNIERLLGNYRQGLIQLAYHYLTEADKVGDNDRTGIERGLDDRVSDFERLPRRVKALTALEFMDRAIPESRIPVKYDFLSLQIGRIYAELGKPEELSRRLDRTIANEPLTAQNSYEYGAYYLSDAKDPTKSRQLFAKSLELDPSAENVTRVAYTWLQFGGDTGYAADLLRQAIEKDGSRQAKLRIAGQALSMGLDRLALSIYEPLRRTDPGDGAATLGLVECYKKTGDLSRAMSLANEWLGSFPADSGMARKRRELQSYTTGQ